MSPSSAASRPSSDGSEPDDTDTLPAGNGYVARLERAVAPYAQRFANAPAVTALRAALPVAFGVAVAALIVLVATSRPSSLQALAYEVPRRIGGAFAVASLAMVAVLAYRLAVNLRYPLAATVVVSCAAFALALPREAAASLADVLAGHASGLGAFERTLGASGLFTAIVVCLATAGAIALGRRTTGAARGTIAGCTGVLAISALLFALHVSIAGLLAAAIAPLATLGDGFVALALIAFIEAALWLVGIHGPALLAAIVLPVYTQMQFANTAAFTRHEHVPHLVVVSTFLFVFPGGAGATLPLVVLLLRSRVARLRSVAVATLVPSIFSVNEPVLFGLPVAYNPVLAVPFVVAPVVLSCTTYAVLALGLVAPPLFYVPSVVPVVVNAFVATLDWRACVLFVVNLAIASAIWFPFVRMYERTESIRLRPAA